MPFTVSAIAAKDGAGVAIGGGLLAGDVAGSGSGPFFLFHGLVDGVAGVNKAQIDISNRLAVLSSIASGGVASGAFAVGSIAVGAIAAGATSIADNEDAASNDGDRGIKILAVRKATPANTSGADGDYEFLQMLAGRLWTDSNIRFAGTTPDLGLSTGGASTLRVAVDTAQLAANLTTAQSMSAFYQLVGLPIDQNWGVGSTGFTKLEDAASADGDRGVGFLAVQKATPANTAGTDGDYEFLQMSAGRLWTSGVAYGNTAHDGVDADKPIKIGGYASAAAPANVSNDGDVVNAWHLRNGAYAANLTASGALIPGDAITGLAVGGAIAHDAADTGKPSKIGFKATTSLAALTLVSDADRTDGFAGVDGVQIVRQHCNLEDIITNVVTCTSGANTSGIAAIGAGIKFYLCAVFISNIGGTAAGNLSVTDGSGGTEKTNIPFSTVGAVENLPLPIPFSANTAVFVDPSGSDTVKVTLVGFKSKV